MCEILKAAWIGLQWNFVVVCLHFTSDVGVGECSVEFTSRKYTAPTCSSQLSMYF